MEPRCKLTSSTQCKSWENKRFNLETDSSQKKTKNSTGGHTMKQTRSFEGRTSSETQWNERRKRQQMSQKVMLGSPWFYSSWKHTHSSKGKSPPESRIWWTMIKAFNQKLCHKGLSLSHKKIFSCKTVIKHFTTKKNQSFLSYGKCNMIPCYFRHW